MTIDLLPGAVGTDRRDSGIESLQEICALSLCHRDGTAVRPVRPPTSREPPLYPFFGCGVPM
jgi:hypothetical protein